MAVGAGATGLSNSGAFFPNATTTGETYTATISALAGDLVLIGAFVAIPVATATTVTFPAVSLGASATRLGPIVAVAGSSGSYAQAVFAVRAAGGAQTVSVQHALSVSVNHTYGCIAVAYNRAATIGPVYTNSGTGTAVSLASPPPLPQGALIAAFLGSTASLGTTSGGVSHATLTASSSLNAGANESDSTSRGASFTNTTSAANFGWGALGVILNPTAGGRVTAQAMARSTL
jgi:hypothetical protein